ncbi:TPM domain-containing protein (plasmid) [Cupriavidus sp. P-10]|nr:TPM domain-containing protein [Cupriavidus sp. P-10]BDB29309.1 TPM domain-containing protein [Cupriavidus sp. P-10]
MENVKRIARHLLMTHWRVGRAFPQDVLTTVEQAIATSETNHIGQLCFVVEGALSLASLFQGLSARERALEVFSQTRVWDTEHNNGVLIYLLLADRSVEIVADRGIHAKVGDPEWDTICRAMEASFRGRQYRRGVITGIQAISQHLEQHFPCQPNKLNELSDKPVLL